MVTIWFQTPNQEIFRGEDSATLLLMLMCRREAADHHRSLRLLVLVALVRLQQRRQHRLLVCVHPGRLDDLAEAAQARTERLRDAAVLQEAEVLLQHRNRTLEGVHGVNELLLGRHEVVVLLVAKLGRFVELGLAGRDGHRKLVDRARERHDRPLRVLDGGLEVADGALRGGDCVLLLVRFRVAPFIEFNDFRRGLSVC